MNTLSSKLYNRIPGFLYLLLAFTGFYTPFVLDQFNIISDSAQWLTLILENRLFFSSGILSFYSMNVVWLLLAFSFYQTFKDNNRSLSLLLLLSVIGGAMIVFVIIILRSTPLYLLSLISQISESPISTFNESLWIDRTYFLFQIGSKANIATYVFYSIWLFPLALLFLKTKSISKVERVIIFLSLCIAGVGYLSDFLLFHIFPRPIDIKVTNFTFFGEVVILLWLLLRGLKLTRESKA